MTPRLRPSGLCVAVTLVASSLAARAGAQTVMPVGKCTGSITADIGFAAKQDGKTGLQSISGTFAPNVFGRAECDCDPSETSGDGMYMRLQISSGLPQGTVTNVSAWVGSGCDNYQTRVNTSAVSCRQFMPANLTPSSFNAGSGNIGTSVFYDLYVPARSLFSPAAGTCEVDATNSIWIFLGTNPMMPDGTCQVTISERATGASPAVGAKTASGDGAVSVSWQVPTTTNTQNLRSPSYFQILCATEDGGVVPDKVKPAGYSTCTSSGIRRRQILFGASNVSGTTDGGVTTGDMGLSSSSQAISADAPPAGADPRADGGTDDMGDPLDMTSSPNDHTPRPTHFADLGPFGELDPKFVCSDAFDATTTTSFDKRIDGLTNNANYQFVVVAIDSYGNPTPSALITGVPKPVDDLYSRYRAGGGTAQGFCFVATAAFGDYDHPQVRVLRAFRDRVLAGTGAGRALIRAYYAASPPLARFIEGGAARRFVARVLLWPLVGLALLALQLGSLALALLVAGGLPALALWLRRRRRLRRRALLEVPA